MEKNFVYKVGKDVFVIITPYNYDDGTNYAWDIYSQKDYVLEDGGITEYGTKISAREVVNELLNTVEFMYGVSLDRTNIYLVEDKEKDDILNQIEKANSPKNVSEDDDDENLKQYARFVHNSKDCEIDDFISMDIELLRDVPKTTDLKTLYSRLGILFLEQWSRKIDDSAFDIDAYKECYDIRQMANNPTEELIIDKFFNDCAFEKLLNTHGDTIHFGDSMFHSIIMDWTFDCADDEDYIEYFYDYIDEHPDVYIHWLTEHQDFFDEKHQITGYAIRDFIADKIFDIIDPKCDFACIDYLILDWIENKLCATLQEQTIMEITSIPDKCSLTPNELKKMVEDIIAKDKLKAIANHPAFNY